MIIYFSNVLYFINKFQKSIIFEIDILKSITESLQKNWFKQYLLFITLHFRKR